MPSEPDAIERAHDLLRAHGGRVTGPRREVLQALVEVPDHPSADQLVAHLERQGSDTHRATVYRTLEVLVDLGVVAHVHLPHGPATYHLVDGDHRAHAHLVCRDCDRIVDVPGLLDEPARHARQTLGFELDLDHVALTGRCRDCLADPPQA